MVEGERVLGRFTVGERIGGGGHGTVHRAWDERLCRSVAVKAVEGASAGRVLREAHAAARLNHPGIVTLYELGQEGNCAYLVSELVEGPNLRELAAAGAISDRDVAEIGAELCAALAHAHAAGVVHRDLKPDNVLVRRRGGRFSRDSGERALLADFGIASVDDAPSLTATGQVVGTLAYMSPEQATGDEVGPASDVYSLALTLYELWAGHNPVVQSTPAATARAIGDEVPCLSEWRPELPLELAAAIDACLDPDPEQRPELVELRESLIALRGSLHPDRAVPEPLEPISVTTLPPGIPARPFAVLLAAGGLALVGDARRRARAGDRRRGADRSRRDPALASLANGCCRRSLPLLGVIGAAPAFLAIAARQERISARAALAALAWAWTGIAAAITGRALGVPAAGDASGWATSGPVAIDDVLLQLLAPTAISVALIWVGGAVLLGVILDSAGPAGAAVGGLIWAAGMVAALGAVGSGALPSALLAPALLVAVGLAIWDRHGRPELRGRLPRIGSIPRLAALRPTQQLRSDPAPGPRKPRNPAAAPLADERIRATRAATRHVRAALHGAESRAGLP